MNNKWKGMSSLAKQLLITKAVFSFDQSSKNKNMSVCP